MVDGRGGMMSRKPGRGDHGGRYRRLVIMLLLIGLGGVGPAAADTRSLYWRALEVSAELDGDGRLHVRERHNMVFTGAWNGGEREFRVAAGQRLQFEGLSEIDPATGDARPLRPGGLGTVGNYQLSGNHLLRWRARRPTDPPFRNAERVYEIRYVLSNILIARDAGYVLDHDFAFPRRPGPIEHYRLDLRWDPVWQVEADFPGRVTREQLRPGLGVVITLPLRYIGSGTPGAVRQPAPAGWRYVLLATLLGFLLWRAARWYGHERTLGRYQPLVPARDIDDAWLARHILVLAPEVVGAAWDKTTSAPEVAAVLARMTIEGKLTSEIKTTGAWLWKRDVLHLGLQVDRSGLKGHERALIDALFFDGDSTDTDSLAEHYRKYGFQPANKIRSALTQRIKSLNRGSTAGSGPGMRLSAGLFCLGAPLMLYGAWIDRAPAPVLGIAALVAIGAYGIARIHALLYENYIVSVRWAGVRVLLTLLVLLAALGYVVVTGEFGLEIPALAGYMLLCAALFNSQFNGMYSRDTREFTLLRKRLASARRYFQSQLQARHPKLQDAWLPYLLAFGLGPQVDRWYRSYGRASPVDSGGNFSSGSRSGSWSGGGGSFGGAGATGSWAAAVGGVAAGVAAPGSGSGGGGGGGGGSSGGGGGGGW